MQSTWNTENAGSATKTIVIPTSSSGTYGCTVDWGDGTTSNISTYNDSAWTHVYASTGTYIIKIYGTFNGMVFNNGGDKLKLLTVTKWGSNFRLGTTQGGYFNGCANLTIPATDILILNGTTSLSAVFGACTSLVTVPNMNSWDVSKVTNLSSAFSNSPNFNQLLSNWDTSSVTILNSAFRGTQYNQSLNSWNVSNVTSFSSVFSRSSVGAAANPSISSWNTSSATNFANFAQNNTTFNQDVSAFNTSLVTTMANAFNNASSANPDVSSWNIAALTSATSMFTGSAFDITNYDKLLDSATGWPSQATIQSNVVFSAGSAHYSAGNPTTGRAILTGVKLWTITDGGTP